MKRRTFLKTLLGVVGVALTGLPKAEAQDIKTPEDAGIFYRPYVPLNRVADVTVDHRGFRYTYSASAYRELMRRLEARERACGVGNSETFRLYCANRIVRISDGKVFKDRNPIPVGLQATPEEFQSFLSPYIKRLDKRS